MNGSSVGYRRAARCAGVARIACMGLLLVACGQPKAPVAPTKGPITSLLFPSALPDGFQGPVSSSDISAALTPGVGALAYPDRQHDDGLASQERRNWQVLDTTGTQVAQAQIVVFRFTSPDGAADYLRLLRTMTFTVTFQGKQDQVVPSPSPLAAPPGSFMRTTDVSGARTHIIFAKGNVVADVQVMASTPDDGRWVRDCADIAKLEYSVV